MTTCIALVRGINLAGKRRVGMADLRGMLEAMGLREVRSLLQSGNVVFETDRVKAAQLETRIEKEASRALGLETEFFVRTAEEWKAIVAKNPFPAEAKNDPQHLVLHVLKQPAGAAQLKALQAVIRGRELARGGTAHAYLVYPDGIGTSRLTSAILDRHLGRGTARNWNTVLKLAAMTDA